MVVPTNDIVCKKCGLVNDYIVKEQGPHKTAFCTSCDKYIKHLPTSDGLTLFFGKYKGRKLSSLVSKDEISWIEWALNNVEILKPAQREAFTNHLKQFNQVA